MAFLPPPVLRNGRLRLGDQTDASRCLVAAIVGAGVYFFVSGQLEARRERKWPFGFWLLIQVILGKKSLGPICCLGRISPDNNTCGDCCAGGDSSGPESRKGVVKGVCSRVRVFVLGGAGNGWGFAHGEEA